MRTRWFAWVYERYTYMHICAYKRSIDSARWPLHFNNNQRWTSFYIQVVFRRLAVIAVLLSVYVIWFEDHYQDFAIRAILKICSLNGIYFRKNLRSLKENVHNCHGEIIDEWTMQFKKKNIDFRTIIFWLTNGCFCTLWPSIYFYKFYKYLHIIDGKFKN